MFARYFDPKLTSSDAVLKGLKKIDTDYLPNSKEFLSFLVQSHGFDPDTATLAEIIECTSGYPNIHKELLACLSITEQEELAGESIDALVARANALVPGAYTVKKDENFCRDDGVVQVRYEWTSPSYRSLINPRSVSVGIALTINLLPYNLPLWVTAILSRNTNFQVEGCPNQDGLFCEFSGGEELRIHFKVFSSHKSKSTEEIAS